MNKRVILAIDPATLLGYCINGDIYGTHKLKGSLGKKWVLFENFIDELIEEHEVTHIVIERAASRFNKAKIHHGKLVAFVEKLAYIYGLELLYVSAKELKKWATGNGNADKAAMIKAARDKGYDVLDDNEADAVHLYRYYAFILNQIETQ